MRSYTNFYYIPYDALDIPSFQSEQDIASRRNNTPQHFPIETSNKGAGSASIAHCLCLAYRVATTPRSYTPALKTATVPTMTEGARRPTDPAAMNLTNLARYDAPKDTATFSNRPVDYTRVHDPHRTAAAAPYCRVLTVARSRMAEVWRRLPLNNQKDDNN
ncbi:hypothetical protein N7449_002125 [Penicillium cf. viridicatum]|uniref:Uncharacterized protein n=1 Tax=Penicillium cf. viridicatum TaxID=2972119 RepID=A0A9W9MUH7_9EURO|nr:hypothetical protein N7449_002125 [Penicillium cf. viridicatum]